MGVLEWFRPPRHLLAMFVAITLVSAAALGWLGWQLVRQDSALAGKRADEQREKATDLAVSALQQRLAEIESMLAGVVNLPEPEASMKAESFARGLWADSVLMIFEKGNVEAYPPNRLIYYPAPLDAPDEHSALETVFAESEILEDQKRFTSAAAKLEKLTYAATPSIRAEALVRLARNLRHAEKWQEAAAVYERLAHSGSVRLRGIPSDLLARDALTGLHEAHLKPGNHIPEALALFIDLHNARWTLTRPVYDHYERRARSWLGVDVPPSPQPGAEAIAQVAAALWDEWSTGVGSNRRRTFWAAQRSVLSVEQAAPARLVMFAAGPDYVESCWLADLAPLTESHGVHITLTDTDGHRVAGPAVSLEGPLHRSTFTGLPWTLSVVPVESAAIPSEIHSRRRLVLAGLLTVGLLVVGGSYLTGRAVARELAVARLQSDFVSAVSHEFRTPLTALRQISELLTRDRVPDENTRRRYYIALEQESRRLHRLVEGLLKFGRMEAGMARYQFEVIDIPEFLRKVIDEFKLEADRHGHRVELNANTAVPLVRADREALSCVIWNLLDNAVKYSPGCSVVWVNLARENDCIAIRVRDEGVGISPEDRQLIFQKFVRGAEAETLGVEGAGIGLAVARQIILRHSGEIRLESILGKGSVFTVLLPGASDL